MNDHDLLILCAYEEANLEPDDGVAAVVQVILNRMRLGFQSDGSVPGTVYAGNGAAFSWAAFGWFNNHYRRLVSGRTAIAARAAHLYEVAEEHPEALLRVAQIAQGVLEGAYMSALFAKITPETVLYLNPDIAHATWATPDKFVVQIGHHAFYHA